MIRILNSFRTVKKFSFLNFTFLYSFCRKTRPMSSLETLRFDNLALRRLPIDPEKRNYVRTVNGACFSKVKPTPLEKPHVIAFCADAMSLLDLPPSELLREEFTEYFSGNRLLPGSEPAAHCYCGHQFGFFSGQLGDGAAIYLGEVLNERNERWEIQLKGAGPTPYSRTADGRKVMRSSVREFLCSEAVHCLGIPSTRAGACITSGTEVIRDIFYDGHPKKEKCTVVLRIAPTFLRFGSFEIFKTLDPITRRSGPSVGRRDILKELLDYTIEVFYPEVHAANEKNVDRKYSEFFKQLVLRTAQLVAGWQCVGFCHGVLNTDNMSIIGLTLDYGPFGFMDIYNPEHVCNSSDNTGRYSYRKQPEICLWNLRKLADAIQCVVPTSETVPLLDYFETEYKSCYLSKMRHKLGLLKIQMPDDSELVEKLFSTMESTGADFTNTFRCLSLLDLPGLESHSSSLSLLKQTLLQQCYPLRALVKSFRKNLESKNVELLLSLSKTSPQFVDRFNDRSLDVSEISAQIARVENLEKMSPEQKMQQDDELWSGWLQMYVHRLKEETHDCSTLSDLKELQNERVQLMNSCNPRFILRNHIAQNAIEKADAGDYSEVLCVLSHLQKPFDDSFHMDKISYEQPSTSTVADDDARSCSAIRSCVEQSKTVDELPPLWSLGLRVT